MENSKKKVRKASHANSWYEGNREELTKELQNYLSKAEKKIENKLIKGIIVPHAGYAFSGQTAAYGYLNINPFNYNRVILLGPCHHMYLNGCGLPSCDEYETPLGNIPIDKETVNILAQKVGFTTVEKSDEEEEHSIEMHLPYIKKIFGENEFKLVPIMVGNLNKKQEKYYGSILSEYLNDIKTLFVISSDFCHWGKNFEYTPGYQLENSEISYSIEKLDKQGIKLIEEQNADAFSQYLEDTDNTICGRHPIGVFLFALKKANFETKTEMLHYAQSGHIKRKQNQSSVSYSSIATYIQ